VVVALEPGPPDPRAVAVAQCEHLFVAAGGDVERGAAVLARAVFIPPTASIATCALNLSEKYSSLPCHFHAPFLTILRTRIPLAPVVLFPGVTAQRVLDAKISRKRRAKKGMP
jgi:hypothetical protein